MLHRTDTLYFLSQYNWKHSFSIVESFNQVIRIIGYCGSVKCQVYNLANCRCCQYMHTHLVLLI